MKRRDFFKTGAAGLATLALGTEVFSQTAGLFCSPTPVQTKGPFYPDHDQLDKDNDLTVIQNSTREAKGQKIYVLGRVIDQNCLPIPGALVEIWQACASGRYNHHLDPNTAPLDPDFQYWGKCVTNNDGRYIFKTILPGAYPADVGWTRPPHIHFKIQKLGYAEMITQMYFAGQSLNNDDLILKQLSVEQQKSVIVGLTPAKPPMDPSALVGLFNISLKKIQRS